MMGQGWSSGATQASSEGLLSIPWGVDALCSLPLRLYLLFAFMPPLTSPLGGVFAQVSFLALTHHSPKETHPQLASALGVLNPFPPQLAREILALTFRCCCQFGAIALFHTKALRQWHQGDYFLLKFSARAASFISENCKKLLLLNKCITPALAVGQ